MIRTRFTVPLVVVILLIAGATGAVATWDTETTTTSTTSDVSGATSTVTLDPGNANKAVYLEVNATTSNLSVEFTPAQKGVDYVAYENSTPDETNAANNHYAWNVTHDELADLPRDVDGGTYNVTVINTTDGSVVDESKVTFDTSGVNDSGAVMAVTADSNASSADASMTHEVADRLELSEEETWAGFGESKNVSTWSGYTTVNGSSSDVTILLEESDAADTYDSAAEDYDDGDWIREATLFANGIPMKIYKNEAPDDVDDDELYAVLNTDTNELDVNLAGEDYEDVSTLQLRGGAGEGYGFGTLHSNFGFWTAASSLLPNL